jgi:hypothetical protein
MTSFLAQNDDFLPNSQMRQKWPVLTVLNAFSAKTVGEKDVQLNELHLLKTIWSYQGDIIISVLSSAYISLIWPNCFQKMQLIKLNIFFSNSFGWKGIQNGQDWSFLSHLAIWQKVVILGQKRRHTSKWHKIWPNFFQIVQNNKGNNFLRISLAWECL